MLLVAAISNDIISIREENLDRQRVEDGRQKPATKSECQLLNVPYRRDTVGEYAVARCRVFGPRSASATRRRTELRVAQWRHDTLRHWIEKGGFLPEVRIQQLRALRQPTA